MVLGCVYAAEPLSEAFRAGLIRAGAGTGWSWLDQQRPITGTGLLQLGSCWTLPVEVMATELLSLESWELIRQSPGHGWHSLSPQDV